MPRPLVASSRPVALAPERAARRSPLARRRLMAAILAAACCLCRGPWGSSPRAALAQEADAQRKAAAEALFEEGRSLLGQGKYAAACERLEQSQRIDAGVGTLLYLGECYERLGRLASAWAIFREAASAARESGQGERARTGDERASALRSRLAQLTLIVPANAPRGFELLLDGQPVAPALFGLPFPVDPGAHEIVARAPGFETWTGSVTFEGEGVRQAVPVAALVPMPFGMPSATPLAPSVAPEASGGDAAASPEFSQRSLAWWVGGSGVAVLGAGAIFGLVAQNKDGDALDKYCIEAGCFDRRGAELNDSARDWALAANVCYGLGAAALLTGAVLYFSGEARAPEPPRAALQLRLAPLAGSTRGLSVRGQF